MHKTVTVALTVASLLLVVYQSVHAQDSREGDSLALVALAELNGGLPWNLEETISNWSGVTAEPDADDRVTSIYAGNKYVGALPTEIGNLTKMTSLTLSNNVIGEIPEEIGTCIELTNLNFDDNALISLPTTIGNLVNLTNFSLRNNTIGSLPPEIGSLSSLGELFLDSNNLTSIPTEMGNLSNLTVLALDRNQLHFDDIELMKDFVEDLYYEPQHIIGTAFSDTIISGMKIGVVVRGSKNHYAWTKDGDTFGGDTDSIDVTEAGVYICNITSDSCTQLTLTHQPITLIEPTSIIVENNKISQSNFFILQDIHNQATIHYQVPVFGSVELTLYDITGQKASTLVSQQQPAGNYQFVWDTSGLAGGIYFCRLTTGNSVVAKKFILFE